VGSDDERLTAMMDRDELAEKIRERVEFKLEIEEEDTDPADHFASGDAEDDAETVSWIRAQLAKGNLWAWFCAKVTARLGDFDGVDILGACSYKSEADFTQPRGYYDGMKGEATLALADSILDAVKRGSRRAEAARDILQSVMDDDAPEVRFTVEIDLGNDAMRTGSDVASAVDAIARQMRERGDDVLGVAPRGIRYGFIHDANGNKVGEWRVGPKEPTPTAVREPRWNRED